MCASKYFQPSGKYSYILNINNRETHSSNNPEKENEGWKNKTVYTNESYKLYESNVYQLLI